MLDELLGALKQGVLNALQQRTGIDLGGNAERPAAAPAGAGAAATPSGPGPAPARDPFGLAGRRMPVGETVDAVLPLQVENFARSRVNDRFGGIRSGGIFAGYRGDGVEVRMLVMLYRDAATAREQVREQGSVTPAQESLGTEPSYSIAPGSVVWSRGAYCFSASSADTEGDEQRPATPAQVAALDRFMAAFPY